MAYDLEKLIHQFFRSVENQWKTSFQYSLIKDIEKNLLSSTGYGELKRLVSPKGVQTWPHPFASMSHSHRSVCVVVAPGECSGFGFDMELERKVKAFKKERILNSEEIEITSSWSDLECFCAKEALFKADLNNQRRSIFHYQIIEEHDCGDLMTQQFPIRFSKGRSILDNRDFNLATLAIGGENAVALARAI